ncbi:SMI1/KNR4 family protein [Psychrobacter urativorans]|uniref:SMI1/KNR4 family protein n=1 Tax=Psychrobacter urativorans TaxID=45610 RepID=UPI00191A738F|nr:SMI1/KNR4 family protein [Psychrobacter urativorans]
MNIFDENGSNSLNQISEIENLLLYKFPIKYVELVQKYDALQLEDNIFDFINIYGNKDDRDINFISLKKNHENGNILDFQKNVCEIDNYGIKHLIVFGICGNGDYVCFDYRHKPMTDNPKVVLVYHDDFVDYEDGSSHMVINHVADSFGEFMDMLHE